MPSAPNAVECRILLMFPGMTGLTFWLPTIVQSFGLAGREKSTLLTIPSACLYIITSVTFGYFFDRTTRFPKPIYMFVAQIVAIGCFIGMTLCRSTGGLFALIMVRVIVTLTSARALSDGADDICLLGRLSDLYHSAARHVNHWFDFCCFCILVSEFPRYVLPRCRSKASLQLIHRKYAPSLFGANLPLAIRTVLHHPIHHLHHLHPRIYGCRRYDVVVLLRP